MSKGSLFWGKGSGKLGETVMYRANGQQITRTYVANPNNPQTNAQMKQRSAFGIIGSANRAVQPKFYPLDKQRTTDYAKFLRANLSADKVKFWNTREEVVLAKANGDAPLEFYQLMSGNLPKPALSVTKEIVDDIIAVTANFGNLDLSWFNSYLSEFAEGETTHQIESLRVINDILEYYNGSALLHPVIAFAGIVSRPSIPTDFTQADFLTLRAMDFVEIIADKLEIEDEFVTLTSNAAQTAITDISDINANVGDKYLSYLTVSAETVETVTTVEVEIVVPCIPFSIDSQADEEAFGVWADVANVKRVGGYDASNLQVTEQAMSVSLPYSFTYPRMRGNGTTPVDLQFIENWKRTIAEGDEAVLKRIGILG